MRKFWRESWKETRREFEILDDGREVPRRITREREKEIFEVDKDRWDFYFKCLGSIAIIIPLFGIWFNLQNQYNQNKFQVKQQRDLFELGIYTKALKNLSVITNADIDSSDLNDINELRNIVVPSISLIGNKDLSNDLKTFVDLMDERQFLIETYNEMNNLAKTFKELSAFAFDKQMNQSSIMEVMRKSKVRLLEQYDKTKFWSDTSRHLPRYKVLPNLSILKNWNIDWKYVRLDETYRYFLIQMRTHNSNIEDGLKLISAYPDGINKGKFLEQLNSLIKKEEKCSWWMIDMMAFYSNGMEQLRIQMIGKMQERVEFLKASQS